MEILEQDYGIGIRNPLVSEFKEDMLEQACSNDFGEANKGIIKLQKEISENDLLHNEPKFCNTAVNIVLERGLTHDNYTVQCAAVGFLGEILSKANGNLEEDALQAIYNSVKVVEDLVNNRKSRYYNNENEKYNRRIRHFARIAYKRCSVIH